MAPCCNISISLLDSMMPAELCMLPHFILCITIALPEINPNLRLQNTQDKADKMAAYRYLNLTIISEADIHTKDTDVFSNAVMARLPLAGADAIGHQNIRDAVHHQFQIDLNIQDISKFGMDYFICVSSSDANARMLRIGSF